MLASSRRRVGAARQAHLLFVAGGALAAVTVVVGLTGVVYYGSSHWAHHSAERRDLATVVALGAGLATAVLCAGLLRLPWAAGSRGVAGRHLLDALVIGFALWFVGWVLVCRTHADPRRRDADRLSADPDLGGDRGAGRRHHGRSS